MSARRFRDMAEVKTWNDEMVARYDLDRFHAHPSPFVRFVESRRVASIFDLLAPQAAHRVLEVGCFIASLICVARTSSAPRKMNGKPSTLFTWFG